MKKIFYLFLVTTLLSLTSCSNNGMDDADAFVGYYTLSVIEDVVLGNDKGTLNDNGVIMITKISENKVKITGYITSEGEVSGSLLYIKGGYYSDESGYFTTSYGKGKLDGNILTFTANQTGQLKYNGIYYPYRNSSYFTAIKTE